MIARREQGADGRIATQGSIPLSPRGKRRETERAREQNRCRGSLQIVRRHARGVRSDSRRRAPHPIEHGSFAKVHMAIHHEPQAQSQPIVTNDEILQPSHASQLNVKGIVVVAQRVAIGEERLTAVLSTHQSEAQMSVEVHRKAKCVAIGIAEIAVAVAFALVEGEAGGE